jgi:dienelactone hydrolase
MIRNRPQLLPSTLLLGLLMVLAPAVTAGQSSGPVASTVTIALEPVSDAAYGLTSVAPVGWGSVSPGIRARQTSPTDPTLLALQSVDAAIDALWPSLLPQLGLTAVPDPVGGRTTDAGFEWQLYQVPVRGAIADLALTEVAGTTYLVLLVSTAAERDALAASVFLPAVDALAPLDIERTPAPSGTGYHEVDIGFPGGASDVTLSGTLTIPDGDGPHPGVVLMTGSGPQDRDESLAGMTLKPFALLADALGRAGVEVLRYDDRGTAGSTGRYDIATLADLTADGSAAVAYLRTRPEVDQGRIGVLGHSEGGAYIAHIAAHDPDVAFVVGLAPMVRDGADLLVDQNGALARSQGASDAEVEVAMQQARALYDALLAGDEARVEALMRTYFAERFDALPADQQAQLGDREAYIQAQIDAQLPTFTGSWFESLLRADPSVDWARVNVPVLGVFGGKDVQVIAGPESAALRDALGERDPRSRIETLPDANHLFQHADTGAVTEYATLDQTFTPELLPLVTSWVRSVTGLDG